VVRTGVAVACGALAGLGAGLAASTLEPPRSVYLATVLVVGIAVTVLLVRPSRTTSTPRWTAAALATALLLVVAAPRPWVSPSTDDVVASWFETTDGTSLTYHHLGSRRHRAATPVVFLHGGPGVSTLQQDLTWLEELARDRPVLTYDQIGTGGSSRLDDPTGYSLERARDDLEAMRRHAGFDRMVLVGHSWGAVIVASYVAAHPERVEAVIALAPGSLDPDGDLADDPSVRLEGREQLRLLGRVLRPRELYTYALSRIDPVTAHRLIGDAEMDRRYEAILQAVWPAMFCAPERASELPPPRGGFFANQLLQRRPMAAELVPHVADPPPTLVLKPECDYLPWSVVDGFVDRLDAQVAYVEGAGHAAHLEERNRVTELVADFLAGGTPAEVLADPTTPPSTFQGPP
jgi:proline iminopeptidase